MAHRMCDGAVSGRRVYGQMSRKSVVEKYDEKTTWIQRTLELSKLSVFKEPQSLIVKGDEGHLQVQDHILKEIETIDVPLRVVAIAGLYRTGKSYLMNQIAGKQRGFSLGNTVRRHTQGIWAWCVFHPTKKRHVLLLLDTEGFSDPANEDNELDQKIFCLGVLMCSTLIYNEQKVVGADTIQKLACVTTLSSNIQCFKDAELDNHVNEEMVHHIAPIFVLCLRDFYLKLEDEGKKITADEYFESLLRDDAKKGSDKQNEIKKCIRQYFSTRKCYTINMPALPRQLQELEALAEDQLDTEFTKDINKLKEYVYESPPKCLVPTLSTQKPVDGLVFGTTVKTYVACLERGFKFNIEEAFSNASAKSNAVAEQKIAEWLRCRINEIKLPIERKEDLQNIFFEIQTTTMEMYRKEAYTYDKTFADTLLVKIKIEWEELRQKNLHHIRVICEQHLELLRYKYIKDEAHYMKLGGYDTFKLDVQNLESDFFETMKRFDRDELLDAMLTFRKSIKYTKMQINQTEKMIKDVQEKERIDEELKRRFEKMHIQIEIDNMTFREQETRRITEALEEKNLENKKSICIIS